MAENGFIQQYVRFRFRDRSGSIVNVTDPSGASLGVFMYFSNLEIKGNIIEAQRGRVNVYQTYSGAAAYAPNTVARRFDFTINTYEPSTFNKLTKLNDFLRLGYRVEFWILEGYFAYSAATDGLIADNTTPIFTRAVIEYKDEPAHNSIKRGMGLTWQRETAISVYEGVNLTIPANPTAGDPQTDDSGLPSN